MDPKDHSKRRFGLRFSGKLEQEYLDDMEPKCNRRLLVGYFIGIAITAVYLLLILTVWSHKFQSIGEIWHIWMLMFACPAFAILAQRTTWAKSLVEPIAAACLILYSSGVIQIIMHSSPDRRELGFGIYLVIIMAVYTMYRLRVCYSSFCGITLQVLYFLFAQKYQIYPMEKLIQVSTYMFFTNFFGIVVSHWIEKTERMVFLSLRTIEQEREKSDKILNNILPEIITKRLKSNEDVIADYHSDVTVLFADIVGYTDYSSRQNANDVVAMLSEVFAEFDQICIRQGIEKIKTIGDAYMAAAGVPFQDPDHAVKCVRAAAEMTDYIRILMEVRKLNLEIRVGLHSGPVIAGVMGHNKMVYDLWGDTVNIASRIETNGVPGHIHISASTYTHILGLYPVSGPVYINAKGKGKLETYTVQTHELTSKNKQSAWQGTLPARLKNSA